ncbi:MAG: hypothetical protein IPL26_04070 [Leptospiraceae bacterium]|nr:hypothetical protein [Leptospiraceae bacterium]
MGLRNKLFLILFNVKQEDKWESWKRFAIKNNYLFSILNDPIERPIIRGTINEKPFSIEAIYESNLEKKFQLKIKSPIHNPKDSYLLIQDKKIFKTQNGVFFKSLQGICDNKFLEKKFFIKSNSERLSTQILRNPTLSEEIISLDNFSIEIIGYELVITSYTISEINKEFIDLLKLFYSFLTYFEEISLTTMNIRT